MYIFPASNKGQQQLELLLSAARKAFDVAYACFGYFGEAFAAPWKSWLAKFLYPQIGERGWLRKLTMPIEEDMLIMSFAIFENIMMTTSKPDQLLLRFRPTDTQNGISRATVRKLAEHLGFTGEAQVIHYAMRKLAKEVLPAYEADDGELMPTRLTAIRKAIPQGRAKSVKSSLF